MTDALHRCVRCGMADSTVFEYDDKGTWQHLPVAAGCEIASLKRQLAAERAIVDRCRPYVEYALPEQHGPWSDAHSWEVVARALLADISGRG
jgi:hypothetical protein